MDNAAAATSPTDPRAFKSFAEFYPFYLSEHSNRTCRRLHFVGSSLSLAFLLLLATTGNAWWLLAGLLFGYGFAWVGHFGFEKNKPASFKARSTASWATGRCTGTSSAGRCRSRPNTVQINI